MKAATAFRALQRTWRQLRRHTRIWLVLLIFLLGACQTPATPPPTSGDEKYFQEGNAPAIRLSDGKVVLLDRLEDQRALIEQFPIPDENSTEDLLGTQALTPAQTLPAAMDLRSNQTPIRDQGGRGTCVAFATAAAIEAAYKRERGLTLDLSEQYANHIQKMTALPREPLDPFQRETQLGAWGGSGVGYQLGWLFRLRFGLPPENALSGIVAGNPSVTYLSSGNYENTNQDGDVPRLRWDNPSMQAEVDTWNLNHLPTAYSIPDNVTLTNLPREALAQAIYGVNRVRVLRTISLEALKTELAAGREIAFSVTLTRVRPCDGAGDTPSCRAAQATETTEQYRDGVWRPLTTDFGGHAMLMVGYDDARRVFLVKNSWGRDTSGRGRPIEADPDADGFIAMSYDWLSRITEAVSILETREPTGWAPYNQQVLLGLWKAEFDSFVERADLAAYHLPYAFPREALSGQTDRRIGTVHSPGAGAFRLNGSVAVAPGRRSINAFFGTNPINNSYDAIDQGYHIRAYGLSGEPQTMAGWVQGPTASSNPTPFFASLDGYPTMVAARPGASTTTAADYLGAWEFSDDGERGRLLFERINPGGTVVVGRYQSDSEEVTGVTLTLSAGNPCRVSLRIPFREGAKTYEGALYCLTGTASKRALLAGTSGPSDAQRGFYAYRAGDTPLTIKITSPTDGTSYPRGSTRVDFTADVTGANAVSWTSSIDGDIGTGTSISRLDLSFGTHLITATASDTEGATASDSITITITNDPPTVDILEPSGSSEPFCVDETISFRATVTDLNNPPGYTLPDSSVGWRASTGETLGTGKAIGYAFATAGGRTVIVRATDSQGAYDEASLNVNVIECSDSPPSVRISTPAADTGTSDADYAYDGFDDSRGMWYADVSLAGEASDPEDGALSGSSLVWTTNRNDLQSASLGTGNALTVRLFSNTCTGVWHEVTLTATDRDGNARAAARRIFIWTLC